MDNRQTEEHILKTARHLFFTQGRLHAKTQEIADEAKVNRALLHYYFRNREKLFEEVLKDALKEAHDEFFRIISHDIPFEEKIREIVSHMLERTIKYPYLETFIISEMIKNPDNLWLMKEAGIESEPRKKFRSEIMEYIEKHQLPHGRPQHFIANLFALCSYPSVAKPLLMNLFQFGEADFQQFIQERKNVITDLLLGKNQR